MARARTWINVNECTEEIDEEKEVVNAWWDDARTGATRDISQSADRGGGGGGTES